jgi:hypothetical protein
MANERLAGGNSESEYSSIDGICATQQILYLLDDEILREGTHSDNHSAKTNEMAQSLLYTFLLSRWAGQNQAVIPKINQGGATMQVLVFILSVIGFGLELATFLMKIAVL